jgi:hypothetical protein
MKASSSSGYFGGVPFAGRVRVRPLFEVAGVGV